MQSAGDTLCNSVSRVRDSISVVDNQGLLIQSECTEVTLRMEVQGFVLHLGGWGMGVGGCKMAAGGFLKMKWLPTFLVEVKINCDILQIVHTTFN